MKTKNILMMALSLSLVAVITVGGTLAYFTASADPKKNVFTTGNVDIELVDEAYPIDGSSWDISEQQTPSGGYEYTNVIPGDTIGKKVGVSLKSGSADCYVAIKVELSSTVDGLDMSNIISQLRTTAGNAGWEDNYVADRDGNTIVFYSQTALNADKTSMQLFDRFQVPTTWGNEVVNKGFDMTVSAAAVQVVALDPPALKANGDPNTALQELLNAFEGETSGSTEGSDTSEDTEPSGDETVEPEAPVTGNE